MSAAPQIKYTDRDLREDVALHDRAEEYARNYTGEFQFLIDAKMSLERDGGLPTPVARGVLNCMRVDPRVAGTLPPPLPPQVATVTTLRPARRLSWGGTQPCGSAEEHDYHSWEDEKKRYNCNGWHKINRGTVDSSGYRDLQVLMEAKTTKTLATARGGALIHKILYVSTVWTANPHKWGFNTVTLSVKTKCKYPSILVNPWLLDADFESAVLADRKPCPHCAKEEANG